MSEPESNVDVNIRAQTGALGTGLAQAQAQIKGAVSSIKGTFEGFESIATKIQAPFLALTAVLGGGEILGAAVELVNDLAEELGILSQKTGATVEELSQLRYVALQSDTPFETVTGGMQKMARAMDAAASGGKEAQAAFSALGVKVTDAAGNLRPMQDVLLDVADKFSGMQDGARKSALAMAVFGKSGADLIPLLNQGRSAIANLAAESDRMGLTMSSDAQQIASAYDDAMNRVKSLLEGATQKIVIGVMPTLTALAQAFVDTAESADKLDGPITALRVVLASLAGTTSVAMAVWQAYIVALNPDNWGQGFGDKVGAVWDRLMDRLRAVRAEIDTIMHGDPAAGSGGGNSGRKPAPAAVDPDAGKDAKKKADHAAEEARAVKRTQIEAARDAALTELAIKRDHLEALKRLQAVSDLEAVAESARIADQEYQVRQEALAKLSSLYLGHVRERSQIEAESARNDQQHQRERARADDELLAARTAAVRARLQPLVDGMASAFDGLITGQKTLLESMGQMLKQYEQMAMKTVARIVVSWVTGEQAKTGATAAGTAARLATEALAHAKSLAMAIAHGLKHIAVEAAKAAAATFSAMAQLGLAGVIAAPIVAGAALFTVLNYGKKIASAAGGYDIPAGVNPVTQLHAQEMVLPAKYAEVIRGLADGGGGGGGAPVHLHLHAADARSARRFLLDNHEAVGEAVRKAVRNNMLDAPGT